MTRMHPAEAASERLAADLARAIDVVTAPATEPGKDNGTLTDLLEEVRLEFQTISPCVTADGRIVHRGGFRPRPDLTVWMLEICEEAGIEYDSGPQVDCLSCGSSFGLPPARLKEAA